MRVSIFVSAVLTVALSAGCSDTPTEETVSAAASPQAEPAGAGARTEAPEPTAEAVWKYLDEEDFKNWELWPNKGEFFEGKEPHGALLTNYLNPVAFNALKNKTGTMPPGSIIVKENFSPEKELMATTVMYKSQGFDREHNDWFWSKRLPDGTVEASGKVAGCQNCHGTASANDYVLTSPIQ